MAASVQGIPGKSSEHVTVILYIHSFNHITYQSIQRDTPVTMPMHLFYGTMVFLIRHKLSNTWVSLIALFSYSSRMQSIFEHAFKIARS